MAGDRLGQQHSKPHELTESTGFPRANHRGFCSRRWRRAHESQRTNVCAHLLGDSVSLQSAIYTYDGWAGVIYFSEEVKHPGRDIPRALFGGVLSIAAIYLLVNLALLYVLPIAQIAGKEFAAGEAANVIFGVYGDTIFRCLTIVSMLSGINALHLMATRVIFAMSRDGLFTSEGGRG